MAPSTYCMVLLAAALALHPAFASDKHAQAPSSPFLKTKGNDLLKEICDDKQDSKLCREIFERGKDQSISLSTLNDIGKAKSYVDLAIAVALRASKYMDAPLKSNRMKQFAAYGIQNCRQDYTDIIAGLKNAYKALKEHQHKSASKNLADAGYKVGFCENAMNLGDTRAAIPSIDQTNKVLRSLIENAQSVIRNRSYNQVINIKPD